MDVPHLGHLGIDLYLPLILTLLMSGVFRICAFVLVTLLSGQLIGQGFNIGIRAGIGQNKFTGPLERDFGESYGLTGGFHFGLSYQLNFSDVVGWRTEILYNQMGSSYKLDTPEGFYVFRPDPFQDRTSNIVIRDTTLINLTHSNAYLQFPQTINIKLGSKVEVFGGAYIGFLLSPVATGNVLFGGPGVTQEHSFRQGLNFNYFDDDSQTKSDPFRARGREIQIRAEGYDVTLRGIENSYDYQQFEIDEGRFFSTDFGLIAGASYYINRGLYVMGRIDYGVKDITRNTADYSFARVNRDESPVFNNDSDKNLGFYISIGFKF